MVQMNLFTTEIDSQMEEKKKKQTYNYRGVGEAGRDIVIL